MVPPRVGEVRDALEAALTALDPAVGIELVGTLVTDDRHLVVLVRDTSTGDLHRTSQDVREIREQTGATTPDRLVHELLHGAVHYQDLQLIGTDRWGVRDWR